MTARRHRIIGKSRYPAWAKIMRFYIGNGRIFVCAYHFSNRRAASPFFHRIVHAAGHGEAHAKKRDADNEKNEDRTNNGKFNGRGPTLVVAYVCPEKAHGYFNRIIEVFMIGVGNTPATVTPGNIGA